MRVAFCHEEEEDRARGASLGPRGRRGVCRLGPFGPEPDRPTASPPEQVNMRTPDSAAMALASSVLPVPGAPASSTPPILGFEGGRKGLRQRLGAEGRPPGQQ